MSEALISAAAAILVCLINNAIQLRSINKKNDANAALIAYRIEQLEKKTQAHNNLIERMYRVEERTDLHEERIKVANHRIEDLEKARG